MAKQAERAPERTLRLAAAALVAAALGVAAALSACTKKDPPAPQPTAGAAARAPTADATPPGPVPGKTEVKHGLTWYEDDPTAAIAEATRTKRPLVVDLWAPWCHTCLAMQNYILTAANLPGVADRFVFLAVDTEKAENAPFLTKVPVEVWPTFYVLGGGDLAVHGRWLGAGSPAQFRRFLDDGARAHDAAQKGALAPDDPLALTLAGDALAASKDMKAAAEKYRAALAAAPADWARRPDVLVALASALARAGDHAGCVALGLSHMNDTGNEVSAGDFAVTALGCADELPAGDPQVKPLRAAAEARLAALCDDPAAALSPDDRADVCTTLQEARSALGDAAGAKRATARRIEVMEAAMRGLPDDVAVLFDWNLADAYLTIGRTADAITLIEKRQKALPDSYLPPHYLARAHLAAKTWNAGLVAVDRALELAYGPRKLGIMTVKVDLLVGAGKKAEAKAVLEAQVAGYAALPEGQKQPGRERAAAKRLAEWK